MKIVKILAAVTCCVVLLALAGCVASTPPVQSGTTVGILYTGFGTMPTLMATKQIDGYIAWQPFVEVAPMAGFGKVLSYTGDLPPDAVWKNHPCCVLAAREDLMARSPDLVNAVTAATILSTRYVNEHQEESGAIVADWLAGKGNFTYGNISVSSVDAMTRAIYTVKFTNEPTDAWENGILKFMAAQRDLGVLKGPLSNSTDDASKALIFDTGPYRAAIQMLEGKRLVTPAPETRQLGIGYLMSDHDTALFVAVKKWQYFNDTYGIALKPRDPTQSKPDLVDLLVNGQKVAEIKLVPGEFGGPLMQLASTDTIQFVLVGNPPAMASIDKGNPVKILMALNTEGSGVVVSSDAPASDWPSFLQWAKERSDAGKPLRIASPGKGSIQDILLSYTLKSSGVTVKEVQV
jgi:NitT/TauT family transport system substrate-binding protein